VPQSFFATATAGIAASAITANQQGFKTLSLRVKNR
jgi:hypothetical protein